MLCPDSVASLATFALAASALAIWTSAVITWPFIS
jgi:hypothetical protein